MAKQLNVNLAFSADTSKIKQQLQGLQNDLAKISQAPADIGKTLTVDLQKASEAASALSVHLKKATNVQTGTLDFAKLNKSLNQSGVTLSQYGRQLQRIGPEGQKAFMSLARAVSLAEMPIRRSNAALKEMAVVMKNTVRWQISSSALHAFMGTVQSAYSYAKNLDESLNNIRIVTGQNADQMARFAAEANKAAQALSTTTNEYAKASLIYYQQGLSDEQVKERTDVTIKMANVARESAETVSDQMTAVWNNFYDGSQSLESYADKMTALGAATASSTSEISEGLNKFAAISDTVGLSFDYAASALATVTATTRQSADIVGTAFKTMFARIQGLKLGETLEDGTTLNKYSEALQAVGINIKDADGGLKDMDNILSEMAIKWEQMNKDQQVALAQTVAGTRQYTQLVALMDNWDFMEENLKVSKNAAGTLQKQQEIYAEGWEAARDRARAAAESVYNSLIDEDVFKTVLNVSADILNLIDNMIKSVGGLNGVLSTLGAILIKVFSSQLATGLQNTLYNIQMSTKIGREKLSQEKKAQLAQMGEDIALGAEGTGGEVGEKMSVQYQEQIQLQAELEDRSSSMGKDEIARAKELLDIRRQIGDQIIATQQKINNAKDAGYDLRADAISELLEDKSISDLDDIIGEIRKVEESTAKLKSTALNINSFSDSLTMLENEAKENQTDEEIQNIGNNIEKTTTKITEEVKKLYASFGDTPQIKKLGSQKSVIGQLLNPQTRNQMINEIKKAQEELQDNLARKQGTNKANLKDAGVTETTANAIIQNKRTIAQETLKQAQATDRAKQASAEFKTFLENSKPALKDWTNGIISLGQGLTSLVSIFNILKGLKDTLSNPDLSGWEKFVRVLSSVGTLLTMTVMATRSLIEVHKLLNFSVVKTAVIKGINTAATILNAKAEAKYNNEVRGSNKELAKENIQLAANSAEKGKNALSSGSFSKALGNLGKSAGKWIGAHKMLVGTMAVASAIVVGSIIAYSELEKAYQKDAIAAKQAKEESENLSKSYEDAKNAYQELTSTVSNYENAKESLSKLTEGTVEFKEKLFEANEAAMKIISTFDGIKYSINDSGLINIDQASLEKAQAEKLNDLQKSQQASMIASQNAKEAQTKANITEFNRNKAKSYEFGTSDDYNTMGKGAAIGAGAAATGVAIGAALGSVVPVVGNVVGAALGGLAGAIVGGISGLIYSETQNDQTDKEIAVMNALADAYRTQGDAVFDYSDNTKAVLEKAGIEYNADTARLIASLKDNDSETQALVKELAANTAANEALNKNIINNSLSDNNIVQNSKHSSDVTDVLAEDFDEKISQAEQQLIDSGWGTDGIAQIDKVNEEAEKIFAEYAKAANLEDVTLTDTTGNDSHRKFIYEDKEGKEQSVSLETMRNIVATQEASEGLKISAEKLAEVFNKLDDTQMGMINSTITGDVGKLNVGSLVNGYEVNKTTLSDWGLTNADAIELGFDNLDAMVTAMNDSLEEAQNAWATTLKSYSENTKDYLHQDAEIFKDVSQASFKTYAETLEAFNRSGGEAAVQSFSAGMESLLDANVDKKEEIISTIANIEWDSSEQGLNDLLYQLTQMGIVIDQNGDTWQSFVKATKAMNFSVVERDLDNIRASLVEIKKIAKDIKIGGIISDEDYNTLIKYNAALREQFAMTADGYMYVGDGNISQVADDVALAELAAAKDKNKQANQAYDNLNNWGWKDSEGNWTKEDWYGLANGTDSNESMAAMTNALLKSNQTDLEALGFDAEYMQEMAKLLETGDEEQKKAAKIELQKVYTKLLELNKNKENGLYDDENAESVYASGLSTMTELNSAYSSGNISEKVYNNFSKAMVSQEAASATSLSELEGAMSQVQGETDYSIYSDNLIRLGESYSICKDEILKYQQALASKDKEQISAAEEALETAVMLGEASKKYSLDIEELDIQSKELAATYGLDSKAAAKLAIENQRMNKGVKALTDNWEDWKKELNKTDKTTVDFAKTSKATSKAIADLVGASDDLILSSEFLTDNMDLIDKAAKGDIKSISVLGAAVAAETVSMIENNEAFQQSVISASQEINETDFDPFANFQDFETNKAIVLQGITDLKDALINGTQEVNGAAVGMGDDWVTALNQMAMQTGMSVEQMNSILSSAGVDAHVVTQDVDQEVQVPKYKVSYTNMEKDDETGAFSYETTTKYIGSETMPGKVPVAQISMGDNPGVPDVKYIGGGSVAPSSTKKSGGGGGGSKKKHKPTTHKKSDTVERYKEINDQIDDLTDSLDEANKATDRLYGQNKLNQMAKVNDLIKKEIELTKKKKQEAEGYLVGDQAALNVAASNAGINFDYDEKGNITNYTKEMTKLFDQLQKAQDAADAGQGEDEAANEALEAIQNKIAAVKEALSQYDDTKELIEDLNKDAEEQLMEWQDNNYEMLQYELEIKIEVNDMELETIEYYMQKLEGDFYKMAEAAGYLGQQFPIFESSLKAQEDFYNKLVADKAEGKISEEKYIEGLKNSRAGILENLQALREMDKTMMEYYGNTLVAAGEELAKYTDRMSHQASVLDHYKNIMELMGKSKDYKAMNKIIEGQIELQENQVEVARKEFDFYANQAAKKKAALDQAYADGNAALAEQLKKEWEAAESAANEAQDRLLSETEAWAEKVNERLTMQLEEAAEQLSKTLAGDRFSSLEALTEQMERASSLQEEYLTTTNKIYETNKLIHTAQADIDATTNSIAKNKLKNFIKETEALQAQGKVSEYELSIQQAKYDLLVAEIALEDAQNAKSQVQLSRDSEGNFSYVYTADQGAIAEAEQKYADAQNNLYNIGLEGANEYTEKFQQTMTEMWDKLTELQTQRQEGLFASEEEYNAKVEATKSYYYERLKNYSNLYSVALKTDSRVAADAWSTDFSSMMDDSESWKTAVDGYLSSVDQSFKTWETDMQRIADQSVGTDLESLKTKVDSITDASEELTEELTKDGGVIDSIEQEVDKVSALTEQYGSLRFEVQETINTYEKLLAVIGGVLTAQGQVTSPETGDAPNAGNNSDGSDNSGTSDGDSGNSTGNDENPTGEERKPEWSNIEAIYHKICSGEYPNGVDNRVAAAVADGYLAEEARLAQRYIDMTFPKHLNGEGRPADQAKAALGFDTGGYTGEWGPEGKLAFLHQKELVLNASDTDNLLSAINLTRDMLNIIDLNAQYASAGFGALVARGLRDDARDILEQQVHIEAHFPSVNSHIEIEEAFNNLINTASQYANRK